MRRWISTSGKRTINLSIVAWKISPRKKTRVFPIILNQCLPLLRLQLQGAKTFEEMYEMNDIVKLFKLICSFCCKHDQNNEKYYAAFNSLQVLLINFQGSVWTNEDYLKEFQAQMLCLMTIMQILSMSG